MKIVIAVISESFKTVLSLASAFFYFKNLSLIPNDEATCVVTPSGSEMHECKVINVGDEQEWHVQAKRLKFLNFKS